jgi:hypothetical protein
VAHHLILDKHVYPCKTDASSFSSAEKEFEVDGTLPVSDDHYIVAPLVRRFVTRFDMGLNVRACGGRAS